MNYSVTVNNQSGAPARIAMFLADPLSEAVHSLLWQNACVGAGDSTTFAWDSAGFQLGWGSTGGRLAEGVLHACGGITTALAPRTAHGANSVRLAHASSGFQLGSPWYDPGQAGAAAIVSDTSFTVTQAAGTSVTLYLDAVAALAVHCAPNTTHNFALAGLVYYLTVTNAAQGMVLPQRTGAHSAPSAVQASTSISTPYEIRLGDGPAALTVLLDPTLTFHQAD